MGMTAWLAQNDTTPQTVAQIIPQTRFHLRAKVGPAPPAQERSGSPSGECHSSEEKTRFGFIEGFVIAIIRNVDAGSYACQYRPLD